MNKNMAKNFQQEKKQMEETKVTQTDKQPKQLSYEELKNIAGQLQQQNMQLRKALQDTNYANMFKRLDYLFKVMEFAHMFSDKFVTNCSSEIELSMTIPDNEPTEDVESKEE